MTRIQDDVKAVRRCLENYLDRDGAKAVIVPVARIDRILNRLEKYEKVLNKIAMIGCSELAYSKEFTERVNQLIRDVLKENE
jgi:hypothetical protein